MTKLLISLVMLVVVSCVSEKTSCVNEENMDPDGICTMQYDPVCGCNNVTYGNVCEAKKAGVTSWEQGECKKGS